MIVSRAFEKIGSGYRRKIEVYRLPRQRSTKKPLNRSRGKTACLPRGTWAYQCGETWSHSV